VLAIVFLGPLTAAADWAGSRLGDANGVLALAAFSTIFKLAGIVVFYPWLDHFCRFIIRISGRGSDTAVSRLEPTVAQAGGGVALEAAWRATVEVGRGALDAVRRRLAGESVTYASQVEAMQQIDGFLEKISLDTIDPSGMESRLIRLFHALDHLAELQRVLTRIPPVHSGWLPPAGFAASERALAAWLDSTTNPAVAPDPSIASALQSASEQLSEERRTGRDKLLEDVALQRMSAAAARQSIDALAWAEDAVHHASRLVEALELASGR